MHGYIALDLIGVQNSVSFTDFLHEKYQFQMGMQIFQKLNWNYRLQWFFSNSGASRTSVLMFLVKYSGWSFMEGLYDTLKPSEIDWKLAQPFWDYSNTSHDTLTAC